MIDLSQAKSIMQIKKLLKVQAYIHLCSNLSILPKQEDPGHQQWVASDWVVQTLQVIIHIQSALIYPKDPVSLVVLYLASIEFLQKSSNSMCLSSCLSD